MSLLLESEKKIEVDVLQKQSFSIDDSRVVIKFKEGEEVFNLNEVTKVRLQKERNVSINIVFLFFTLLLYSIASDYYDYIAGNFRYHFLSYAFTVVGIIVSLPLEFYTYELYVHTKPRFQKTKIVQKRRISSYVFCFAF
jgi:hypothetical protein